MSGSKKLKRLPSFLLFYCYRGSFDEKKRARTSKSLLFQHGAHRSSQEGRRRLDVDFRNQIRVLDAVKKQAELKTLNVAVIILIQMAVGHFNERGSNNRAMRVGVKARSKPHRRWTQYN